MSFVLSPWRTLRYTHLTSSLILALPWMIGYLAQAFQAGARADAAVLFTGIAALHLLLFPLARELYFTLTEPIRRGLGGFVLWGPLALVMLAGKIAVYLLLSVAAVPIGVLGFVYLAFRARYRW